MERPGANIAYAQEALWTPHHKNSAMTNAQIKYVYQT